MTISGFAASQADRVFIAGQSTGIDTSVLVNLAVGQKTLKADQIDVKIADNSAKVSAYTELQTLMASIETSLEGLKSSTDILTNGNNSFDKRAGFLTTSDGSDPTNVLGVSADDGAQIGEYDIVVTQRAEAARVVSASVADQTADLGYAGSFDLGLNGGGSAQIDITADMSLQEIAAAINAETENTGVGASIIQVSETDFQMVLTGQETALDIDTSVAAGDDVLNFLGITDGVGGFNNVIQVAQAAELTIDGVPVTRNTNTIDNLVSGIEFTIQNEAPGTTITLKIEADTAAVKTEIEGFLEAYNALRDFIGNNQAVDEGGAVADSAALFADQILSGLALSIGSLVSGDISGASGTVNNLRDIGIELDANNNLIVGDETALDDALLNNFDSLEGFFSSSVTTDNASIALINNTSGVGSQSFAMDVTVDGSGDVTGVSVGGDTNLFTFTGTAIKGAIGSIYEGLTFSYQGGVNATINIELNQGFADRLANLLDAYGNSSDGLIEAQKSSLLTTNSGLSEEAAAIRTRAEEFRANEIDRYASIEAANERAKILQRQIRALFGTDNDD
jgi:flagellar hook-associated protein 2